MKFYIVLIFVVFLSSCGGDSYDDYVGLWQDTADNSKVLEITKEGENFFLAENVIRDFDRNLLLNKQDGLLSLQGRAFKLIDNGSVLELSPSTFVKITSQDLENYKVEKARLQEEQKERQAMALKEAEAKKEADKIKCDELEVEYQEALKAIEDKYDGTDQKQRKLRNNEAMALYDNAQELTKDVSSCSTFNW